MDKEIFQKRAFILSSFRRLNIPTKETVYEFIDKLIKQNWTPPLEGLNEVDNIINVKYKEFLDG